MSLSERTGAGNVPSESVRDELARLLASERFVHSQALSRFLRYTVEETLQGRGDGLKEYVIGMEALDRSHDFDPRIDPIVRVQAGKLRSRLKEYYENEGAADLVVIEYPKGGYTPLFRAKATASVAAPVEVKPPPRLPRLAWVGMAIVLVVVAAGLVWRWRGAGPVWQLSSLTRLTSDAGSTTFPAISSDAKWMAFASDRSGRGSLDIWVQPVQRGEPIQLTSHEAADITPDFSPDGTQIVFHSNRDGGGLYLVSVLGGPERRVADLGWRPRFSPDGSEIAYQGASPRNGGDLYVISAGGGQPRRVDIGSNVQLGGTPVWTPDGRRLIFLGSDLRRNRMWDWWIVPREGGDPQSTGVAGILSRAGLPALDIYTVPGDWRGNDIVCSVPREDAANLWVIPFSAGNWRAAGPPRQITFGTAREQAPRISRDGRLVFASESQNSHLYELRLSSAAQGRLTAAEPVRVTADLSLDPGNFRTFTRFSANDRFLLFPSRRKGNSDVFYKDLVSGAESAVTANPWPEDQPLLAPDGSRVAYRSRERGSTPIYIAQIGTQVAHKVCDDCGEPSSWSADGRRLLYTSRGLLAVLDIESGRKSELLHHASYVVRHAALTPGQQHLAITVDDSANQGERAFLLPFAGGAIPPEEQWTEVLKGFGVESLHWSSDGSSLFFFSSKDSFRCLWEQRLSAGRRPIEAPAPVAHFHDNRRSPWSSWLAVTRDRLIFSLTEPNSNLWTAQLSAAR